MRPPTLLTIGWLAGGLSWVAATFLSWTSQGLLSRSSLMDAARFVRKGVVDDVVPPGAAFVLLSPAVAGLLLVGLAGLGGRAASAARTVVGLVGAVAVAALGGQLTDWSPGRAGPGAVVAVIGVVVVVVAAVSPVILARTARAQAPDQ